jgi:hypothetical protein
MHRFFAFPGGHFGMRHPVEQPSTPTTRFMRSESFFMFAHLPLRIQIDPKTDRSSLPFIPFSAAPCSVFSVFPPRRRFMQFSANDAFFKRTALHPYRFSNNSLPTPQTGQRQSSGSCSKGVPGATPLSGSPFLES